MNWYDAVFEVIDMRSFSNLWYWIGLAVFWSTNSHWVLGVPFDMVQRAMRHGGEADKDLEDLVRIYCNRINYVNEVSGFWLLAFSSGTLTMLALLGFYYDIEFAQAVLLLAFPFSIVGLWTIRTAQKLTLSQPTGEALQKALSRHRIVVQVIGMISIFVTAMWGMYQNMWTGPL